MDGWIRAIDVDGWDSTYGNNTIGKLADIDQIDFADILSHRHIGSLDDLFGFLFIAIYHFGYLWNLLFGEGGFVSHYFR